MENTINLQAKRMEKFSQLFENLKATPHADLTKKSLKIKFNLLEELWVEIDKENDEILIQTLQAESEVQTSNNYIVEEEYIKAFNIYDEANIFYYTKLDEINDTVQRKANYQPIDHQREQISTISNKTERQLHPQIKSIVSSSYFHVVENPLQLRSTRSLHRIPINLTVHINGYSNHTVVTTIQTHYFSNYFEPFICLNGKFMVVFINNLKEFFKLIWENGKVLEPLMKSLVISCFKTLSLQNHKSHKSRQLHNILQPSWWPIKRNCLCELTVIGSVQSKYHQYADQTISVD